MKYQTMWNMKLKSILSLAVPVLLFACAPKIPDGPYGRWEMLTVDRGDTIILQPEFHPNLAIVYKPDSILRVSHEGTGAGDISETFERDGKRYIVFQWCPGGDTISYEVVGPNLLRWTLSGQTFLATDRPQDYKTEVETFGVRPGTDLSGWYGSYRVTRKMEHPVRVDIPDFANVAVTVGDRDRGMFVYRGKAYREDETRIKVVYGAQEQVLYIRDDGTERLLHGDSDQLMSGAMLNVKKEKLPPEPKIEFRKDTLQYLGQYETGDFHTVCKFLTKGLKTVDIVPAAWDNVLDDGLMLEDAAPGDMYHVEWENRLVSAGGDEEYHYETGYMKKRWEVDVPPYGESGKYFTQE